ncbi:MAG: ferrous iron transport protein A [Halanaerobiaceae bacterium]|nr:ferrous iron transport protein A [Halanaerobiaceae bacterium]
MDCVYSRNIPIADMRVERSNKERTNLTEAEINREYIIKEVRSTDHELRNFLFTLGCYEGESVTVISVLGDNYIISIKDARYSIDLDLAEVIIIDKCN